VHRRVGRPDADVQVLGPLPVPLPSPSMNSRRVVSAIAPS